MKFSPRAKMPRSEWYDEAKWVRQVAVDLEAWCQQGMPFGLDTETDGLGYPLTTGKGKRMFSGDGLGSNLEVVGLAFGNRRIALDVGTDRRENLEYLMPVIHRHQSLVAGVNWIFDANVIEYNTDWRWPLHTLFADAIDLWKLFDEDAEETYGAHGLKARVWFWLGMPMSSFDDVVIKKHGTIRAALQDPVDGDLARSYSSKDPWGHLGLVALGIRFAQQLPWCVACPVCGRECPQYRDPTKREWWCTTHGWIPASGAAELSMWDYHMRKTRRVLPLLKQMEQVGMPVNVEVMRSWAAPLEESVSLCREQFSQELARSLAEVGGSLKEPINPGSGAQLAEVLFGSYDAEGHRVGLGLPVAARSASGAPSVKEAVLQELNVKNDLPVISSLLELREREKCLSTYVESIPLRVWAKTGRVHPRIRGWAKTGRFLVVNPAAQVLTNVPIVFSLPPVETPPFSTPEEISQAWGISLAEAQAALMEANYLRRDYEIQVRSGIEAEEGMLFVATDWRQVEVRVAAAYSGDENLIRVLQEGRDMHAHTASVVFGSVVPGLTYEDIFEAYQWGEGAKLPRVESLLRALRGDTGFLDRRLSGADLSLAVNAFQVTRRVLETGIGSDLLHEDFLEGMPRIDESAQLAWLEQLLARLGGLMNLEELLRFLGWSDKVFKGFRKSAKSAIFGIIYGIGPTGLAIQVTQATGARCTPREAKELIDGIKNLAYPGIGRLIDHLHRTCKAFGYVRTMLGRYRHPSGISSGNPEEIARALRQASNTPIQGTALDMALNVMIALSEDPILRDPVHKYSVIAQIHDEFVSECSAGSAQIVLERQMYHMENSHGLHADMTFPASGKFGKTMADVK